MSYRQSEMYKLTTYLSFSSKHKLHLFDPPVYEIEFFTIDHFMV